MLNEIFERHNLRLTKPRQQVFDILQNSDETAKDVAAMIDEMGLNVVQIIGRNVVVFKVSDRKENRKISEDVKKV